MTRPGWRNHAHWDHSAADPSPTPVDRALEALAPRLRRAHLPRHPSAALALIVTGVCHFLIVGGTLADLADMVSWDRGPLRVAAWALLVAMALPGVALVLAGAWDLAQGPLRHFAPRWARRVQSRR